jgi:hypothetical protein
MTGAPNFRLDLTALQKRPAASPDAVPPDPAAPAKAAVIPKRILATTVGAGAAAKPNARPAAAEPKPNSSTLARKNLIIQSSDSESDLDLELEEIPIGADQPAEAQAVPEPYEAPTIQVSQLPELRDDDDDELQTHGEGKLSLLQDLLLTPEMADEGPDEWNYRKFIKQFAKSEASQEEEDAEDATDEDYDFAPEEEELDDDD